MNQRELQELLKDAEHVANRICTLTGTFGPWLQIKQEVAAFGQRAVESAVSRQREADRILSVKLAHAETLRRWPAGRDTWSDGWNACGDSLEHKLHAAFAAEEQAPKETKRED